MKESRYYLTDYTFDKQTGKIDFNEKIYKTNRSLHWSFTKGDKLEKKINFKMLGENPTFLGWVYNENKENTGKLKFVFKGIVEKSFEMNINFEGWQGICVPFNDMFPKNKCMEYVESIEIIPNFEGNLYFDEIIITPYDRRYPTADYSIPFVNEEVNTSVNKHWMALIMYDEQLKNGIRKLKSKKIDINKDEFKKIEEKMDYISNLDVNEELPKEFVMSVLENLKNYEISENGKFSKRKLSFPQLILEFKEPLFSKEEVEILNKGYDLRKLGQLLKDISKIIRNVNASKIEEIEYIKKKTISLIKFLYYQGFRYGSSSQTTDHLGYQTRELSTALFILRDFLRENNLIKEACEMIGWYNCLGRIMKPTSSNVDVYNTHLKYMLHSILLRDDEFEKAHLLKQYSRWLSRNVSSSKGVEGGFKIDYSMFHHSQHYVAYGVDSLLGILPVVYVLNDTYYAIDEEQIDMLKNIVSRLKFYTNDINVPIVFCGRHPNEHYTINPKVYEYMDLISKELPEIKDNVLVMNFANSVIKRMNDNLVIARGFSKYLVGNEAYEKNNLYGRYMQYGRLEIIPDEYEKRDYRHDGYDFNHLSGTTAPYVSFESLRAKLTVLPSAGLEEMLLSTTAYSGGVNFGEYAMFSMELLGHPKYNQETFKAHKSYFFLENSIVAIGNNINCLNDEEIHTTVFQRYIENFDKQDVVIKDNSYIVDNQVEYIFNEKYENELVYEVKKQKTPNSTGNGDCENIFETLYFNHGKKPEEKEYEYLINFDIGKKIEYETINTKDYHVLKYKDMIFYSVFKKIKNCDVVKKVVNPIMMIIKKQSEGLEMSVVNPDLNLYEGIDEEQFVDGKQKEVSIYSRYWRSNKTKPIISKIFLKGIYTLKEPKKNVFIKHIKGDTLIILETIDARVEEIKLKHNE